MQNSNNPNFNSKKEKISNNTWNIDMILLDKDKEIINLSKINRDLNKKINQINNNIENKDMDILTLKTEISSLELEKKSHISKIDKLNEKIKNLLNELNKRDEQIKSISISTDKKLEEINSAFNNHLIDYSNVLFQSQNLEREVSDLNIKLQDRENKISNFQKIISDLKNENEKILSNNNQENINGKKNIVDYTISNTENITLISKSLNKNDIKEKNIETILRENNILNLIQFFKIQNEKMENFLIKNQKNNSIEKRKSNGFGDSNNIETLKNNFEILLKKIIEFKYNPQFITLNKENSSEIISNKINESELENTQLNSYLIKLKENINQLCEQYINNFNNFINQNIPVMFDNISIPEIKILDEPIKNLKNMINYQDFLFNLLINKPISNLISPKKTENGDKNNDLFDISQSNNSNNSEKNELQNKLTIISDLLQESNKCLAKSQEENKELLERNQALELKINMMNINPLENKNSLNNISLSNPNEKKKQMLIQELEIKDLQVKSLEKLLNQLTYGNKENFAPYKGKIISKEKYNELINVNLLDKSFQKNDKYEKELNQFLNRLNRDFIIDHNGIKYFSKENSFNESIVTGSANYIDESIQNLDFFGKIFKKN